MYHANNENKRLKEEKNENSEEISVKGMEFEKGEGLREEDLTPS